MEAALLLKQQIKAAQNASFYPKIIIYKLIFAQIKLLTYLKYLNKANDRVI